MNLILLVVISSVSWQLNGILDCSGYDTEGLMSK